MEIRAPEGGSGRASKAPPPGERFFKEKGRGRLGMRWLLEKFRFASLAVLLCATQTTV